MQRIGLILLLVLVMCGAMAQEAPPPKDNVDAVIQQATDEFTAGHFYGIPSLLSPVLDRASNEQKKRAYMLLCQVYLLIDDPIAADDSYLKLLKADPEFVASEANDPIEVVYLSRKFTATPIFTPRFFVGFNGSFPTTVFEVNTFSTPVDTRTLTRPGWQLGPELT